MKKTSSRKNPSSSGSDKPMAIERAARKAVAEAIKRHKAAGVPIVVWENGKVVRIPAAKI